MTAKKAKSSVHIPVLWFRSLEICCGGILSRFVVRVLNLRSYLRLTSGAVSFSSVYLNTRWLKAIAQ
jgi:hypothetical protein